MCVKPLSKNSAEQDWGRPDLMPILSNFGVPESVHVKALWEFPNKLEGGPPIRVRSDFLKRC